MNDAQLIAHRGDAARYPENTLPALQSAVAAGVGCVEFDLQMTADGEMVLLHDASLLRTADHDADVRDLGLAELAGISVGEPARFGARHGRVAVPTLAETVHWLAGLPAVTAFVEIKEESSDRFGVERVTRAVMEAIAPVASRCVVISFSAEVLRTARSLGAARIGWCLEQVDAATQAKAEVLAPEVLLADWQVLPAEGPWPGDWRWAVWDVVDPDLALELAGRGIHWIETMAPAVLLADPRLATFRGHDTYPEYTMSSGTRPEPS